jgi:hypothetical protein
MTPQLTNTYDDELEAYKQRPTILGQTRIYHELKADNLGGRPRHRILPPLPTHRHHPAHRFPLASLLLHHPNRICVILIQRRHPTHPLDSRCTVYTWVRLWT